MLCEWCKIRKVCLVRPSDRSRLCKECFINIFEEEVHTTIIKKNMFTDVDKICIGVSGGKDSSVLTHVLVTIKKKYNYKWDLFLLAIDEGIKGYRDDSLKVVYKLQQVYNIPLKILKFEDLFNYTMDNVVSIIGKKNNCTVCGVFRRQALEKGAVLFNATKLVTGHNADDLAETILMNFCRGDVEKLAKTIDKPIEFDNYSSDSSSSSSSNSNNNNNNKKKKKKKKKNTPFVTPSVHSNEMTKKEYSNEKYVSENCANGEMKECCCKSNRFKGSYIVTDKEWKETKREVFQNELFEKIDKDNEANQKNDTENVNKTNVLTSEEKGTFIPRLKPLMLSYEKEIVLYAFHLQLDYFSTECIYSPNSFRGNLRSFIKEIEIINPQFILNIIHSAEFFYIDRQIQKQKKLKRCKNCGVYTSNDICKACIIIYGLTNYTDNSFLYQDKKKKKKNYY